VNHLRRHRGQRLSVESASASRSSSERKDDDYDVLADGVAVGRIFKAAASPVGTPWMWTLIYGHHEDGRGCILTGPVKPHPAPRLSAAPRPPL
jgi:hypothetical protein